MRINIHDLSNARVDGRQDDLSSDESASAGRCHAATPHDVSTHTPAPELIQLATQVRATDEIRLDVVKAVVARLASGEYSSRAAAEQTAEKILKSTD